MEYRSTRGTARHDFRRVLLSGLGENGGLLMPCRWPSVAAPSGDYRRFAFAYTYPYVEPCLSAEEYRTAIDEAYAGIADPPLIKLEDDLWLLELSGGPSLAFKDFALQLLAALFARLADGRLNVLVATSGDTGAAAAAALARLDEVNLFILHPQGRIAELQRRQMTTYAAANVHNLAIRGDFDSCQTIVKTLLAEPKNGYIGVNSVNWARIAAQTAYYGYAAAKLAEQGVTAPHFVVPTGNFGNIFAAYAAGKAGVVGGKLIMAVNANDALVRLVNHGRLEKKTTLATLSPSMDIQAPSNFERILYELGGQEQTERLMAELKSTSTLELPPPLLEKFRAKFAAIAVDDALTLTTIAEIYEKHGLIVDPHTAVGLAAALQVGKRGKRGESGMDGVFCCLATANAAKFPEAVEKAIGKRPQMPAALAKAAAAEESFTTLPADTAKVSAYIKKYV